MFKRNSIIANAFSAIIFTTLCLFPSVVGAQASGERQEDKPPKGSRSNINNHRTGGTRFDPIVVDLKKASGEKVATLGITDLNGDGKISDAETAFDFGAVSAADYVLALNLQGQVSGLNSDLTARVTITGTVEGKVEKDWKFESSKASDATSPSQRVGGLSSELTQLRIPFKADGKMKIAGKITLPTGSVIIKNIGKPN